jgi:L-threonylcarbamoyladenylate synthase
MESLRGSGVTTSSTVEETVEALRRGEPVVLPTDTVYGLAAMPYREDVVQRLYELKGRDASQAMAIVAVSIELLFECIPELRGRTGTVARALLPGPFTLVVPNPARRYRWLTGSSPGTLGVRVPELTGPALAVLQAVGAVAATSANLPGGPDPARLGDVAEELRAGCGAALDGGELPGKPSTVIDLTPAGPRVIREGIVPAAEALERVEQALANVR